MIHDLQRNHPTAARDVMRTTRVRSKVERSRACAPLTKTSVWDSGFFAHALFMPKTPNVMGFSGSVNGTTKNPGFLDFGFCQCKWAYFNPLKTSPEYTLGLSSMVMEIVWFIAKSNSKGKKDWKVSWRTVEFPLQSWVKGTTRSYHIIREP